MAWVPRKDAWPESAQEDPINICESETPAVAEPGVSACCSDPQPARAAEIRRAAKKVEMYENHPFGFIDMPFQ